ncbi:MAG: PadR family transcriptional regulator [Candidatus Bathyarchaeia archaeon]
MEAEILRKLRERTIKNFLDVLVLAELRKGRPMSGYDFITFIHKRFHILMSSGTVYSVLYSLERDGLIKGMQASKKRVYKLTDKGEKTIKALLKAYEKIQSFMATLL